MPLDRVTAVLVVLPALARLRTVFLVLRDELIEALETLEPFRHAAPQIEKDLLVRRTAPVHAS